MKHYLVLFFLYIYCNSLTVHSANNVMSYSNSIPEECLEKLDAFARSASNFTKCSIIHAKPIRLCEKCISQYVIFSETYTNLTKKDMNGTSCASKFISQDRFEVVLEYYSGIMSIWNKGNCNACFDWTKQPVDLSNDVKQFIQMYNGTRQCIIDHSANNSEACEQCMQNYLELSKFYNNMSTDSVGLDGVCMDVIDSMNETRYTWSKRLNCCKLRQSPEIVFLVCTGIIAFLPFIFYLAVRFCGPIRDLPKVLKQTRFKQTILRSVNTRIN